MKTTLIGFLFMFSGISVLNAQPLESLLDEAVHNNLELKILDFEYRAALQKAPQVSQLQDPEIGVGSFLLPVETRLGAQLARLSATQMFPWFGTLEARENLELAKAKALFERIAARYLDLGYRIKQAYYLLYEIDQSVVIVERNIVIMEGLHRLALSKLENGSASAADVLRVELKIEELKQELEILQTARINPIAEINQILNRPLDTDLVITEQFSFTDLPFLKDTLTSNIRENHPMIRMFGLQQEISKSALTLNELEGKPSFGVGFDYILVNSRDDADPISNGRDILQLRASVKVPIYRKKYASKEKEEFLKMDALEDQKLDVISKFNSTIEKAFASHKTAKLKSELYAKQIQLTQSAINILQSDYSSSGKYFDELLRLENELVNYDLKNLKAIVQSHLAKSLIERFIIL